MRDLGVQQRPDPGQRAQRSHGDLGGQQHRREGHNLNCLVLLENGTAMAWGGNEDGQLGDGTRANSYVPVPVQGLTGVTGISAGGYDSLAIVEEDPLASFGL